MATKKTVKTPIDKVFYAVIPDTFGLENGEDISIFDTIEQAFFDAEGNYDVHPTKDKFSVYEIKKIGAVNVKVDVKIS